MKTSSLSLCGRVKVCECGYDNGLGGQTLMHSRICDQVSEVGLMFSHWAPVQDYAGASIHRGERLADLQTGVAFSHTRSLFLLLRDILPPMLSRTGLG